MIGVRIPAPPPKPRTPEGIHHRGAEQRKGWSELNFGGMVMVSAV